MCLSPSYVTGLIESDGCFQIGFENGVSTKLGFKIDLRFSFTQSKSNSLLVQAMKTYFEVGVVTIPSNSNYAKYIVKSRNNLETIIIPHFVKYSLFGDKLESFVLFQLILEITKNNTKIRPVNHYLFVLAAMYIPRESGVKSKRKFPKEKWLKDLQKIYLENFLNFNFSEFEKDFYNRFLEKRNQACQECAERKLSPQYILGLVQGDGCFSPLKKTEKKPRFVFVISLLLDPQNKKLGEKLKDFFSTGNLFEASDNEKTLTFRVQDIPSIKDIIIPFFSEPENKLRFRKGESFDFFKNYFFSIYGK